MTEGFWACFLCWTIAKHWSLVRTVAWGKGRFLLMNNERSNFGELVASAVSWRHGILVSVVSGGRIYLGGNEGIEAGAPSSASDHTWRWRTCHFAASASTLAARYGANAGEPGAKEIDQSSVTPALQARCEASEVPQGNARNCISAWICYETEQLSDRHVEFNVVWSVVCTESDFFPGVLEKALCWIDTLEYKSLTWHVIHFVTKKKKTVSDISRLLSLVA